MPRPRTNRICEVDGCNTKVLALGLCSRHYQFMRRNGSPFIHQEEQHNMTHTKEYRIWKNMKRRCNVATTIEYASYGGRGISVCPEWNKSFISFYEDMGPLPSLDYQIDRIDNDGNYCKENCRWVTARDNSRNRNNNKLTIDEARQIRELHKAGNGYRSIAKGFNVSSTLVGNIVRNLAWRE